ncbi:MAG: hypothetical protein AAB345_03310 [Patescibacteria group bacterium]
MGGGGSFYDRDVTDKSLRTSRGFTSAASDAMSTSRVDAKLLPRSRKLSCKGESAIVYAFDVTGSMGDLPMIIFDKMPMIAGQLVMNQYLKDPMMSLAAVGDVNSDDAPLQVCDFAAAREMDGWLKRIFVERNGGGQHYESYEFMAYYYAYLCDVSQVEMPFVLFTGDEGFRENLSGAELSRRFGGEHKDTTATQVFEDLKKKFKGNVFLIHRAYNNATLNVAIVCDWRRVLGEGRVIDLPDDLAIADVTLGVFALGGGSRTLDEYIKDIRNRPLEMDGKKYEKQSDDRIEIVRKALKPFAETMAAVYKDRPKTKTAATGKKTDSKKASKKTTTAKVKKKPWQL